MFDELEEEPRVDLTPLIDVIFMLVIFFVMTMTFSKPVLDVVLPAAQNSEVRKKAAELVLSVNSDGKYFFNDQEILREDLPRFLSEHPEQQRLPNAQSSQHVYLTSSDGNVPVYLSNCQTKISTDG